MESQSKYYYTRWWETATIVTPWERKKEEKKIYASASYMTGIHN